MKNRTVQLNKIIAPLLFLGLIPATSQAYQVEIGGFYKSKKYEPILASDDDYYADFTLIDSTETETGLQGRYFFNDVNQDLGPLGEAVILNRANFIDFTLAKVKYENSYDNSGYNDSYSGERIGLDFRASPNQTMVIQGGIEQLSIGGVDALSVDFGFGGYVSDTGLIIVSLEHKKEELGNFGENTLTGLVLDSHLFFPSFDPDKGWAFDIDLGFYSGERGDYDLTEVTAGLIANYYITKRFSIGVGFTGKSNLIEYSSSEETMVEAQLLANAQFFITPQVALDFTVGSGSVQYEDDYYDDDDEYDLFSMGLSLTANF